MLVAIPSKGRAGRVTSTKWFDGPTIFCPASEAADYREHHRPVVAVPDEVRGITPTRNWILDWARERGERRVLQVDDDNVGVVKFEGGKRGRGVPVGKADFLWLVANMFDMAEDAGTNLWGLQVTDDGKAYREYSPFSLQSFIPGNLMGIIDDGQRFDERFVVKEDYDYTLQSLHRHRRVFRLNKYAWYVEHQTIPGGCRSYRTMELERRTVALLKQKWGTKLVRTNPKKPYECRIRSPIPGI